MFKKPTVFLKELAKNQTVQGRFFGFLRTMISRSKNIVLLVLRTAGKKVYVLNPNLPSSSFFEKERKNGTTLEDSYACSCQFICCKTSLDAHGTQT
jgi:hypothetical protein